MSLHSNVNTVVSGIGPVPSTCEREPFPEFSGLPFHIDTIEQEEEIARADGRINIVYLKEMNRAKCRAWLNNMDWILKAAVRENAVNILASLEGVRYVQFIVWAAS